jgi:hypothetical protein
MNELTDLEICKRIAEIEGLKWFELDNSKHSKKPNARAIYLNKSENGTYKNRFNPITDDALCLKFIVKHEISIINISEGLFIVQCKMITVDTSDSINIKKAICLAIIKSKV